MTCTFGNRSKRFTQREDVVVADGEPLALHELDDRAVLEIDRRNQHGQSLHEPHRNAVLSRRCCFRASWTLVSA